MAIDFFNSQCKSSSNKIEFGLCDKGTQNPSYLDEENKNNWIVIVENKEQKRINFIAIDNCIEILREKGTKDNSCDGMLCYETNVIFVELKDSKLRNASDFIKKAALQLRTTIEYFRENYNSANYNIKSAYIANKKTIHRNYIERMERFETETGCILRIENRIRIPSSPKF